MEPFKVPIIKAEYAKKCFWRAFPNWAQWSDPLTVFYFVTAYKIRKYYWIHISHSLIWCWSRLSHLWVHTFEVKSGFKSTWFWCWLRETMIVSKGLRLFRLEDRKTNPTLKSWKKSGTQSKLHFYSSKFDLQKWFVRYEIPLVFSCNKALSFLQENNDCCSVR